MRVIGRGNAGSWQIRGVQLGKAIGADVVQNGSPKGLTIVVKKTAGLHGAKGVVWDIVDAWPQPHGNHWGRAECMDWMKRQVEDIQPVGLVAATARMAHDLAIHHIPTLWLPHHCRPGIERNPIRREVRAVGYEGAEHYLGKWRPVLEQACSARGWQFVVNPKALADVDIVVALRDCDGYAPKHWKSNVKIANAQGSGTPFIGNRECGYLETASGAEAFIDDELGLFYALDKFADYGRRKDASEIMRSVAPTIGPIAEKYKSWLAQLKY